MILQRQQSTPSSRPFSWGHANTALRLNDKWSFLTLGVWPVKPYMATTRLDVSALARTPPIKHPCWEGSLCPDPGCGAKKELSFPFRLFFAYFSSIHRARGAVVVGCGKVELPSLSQGANVDSGQPILPDKAQTRDLNVSIVQIQRNYVPISTTGYIHPPIAYTETGLPALLANHNHLPPGEDPVCIRPFDPRSICPPPRKRAPSRSVP